MSFEWYTPPDNGDNPEKNEIPHEQSNPEITKQNTPEKTQESPKQKIDSLLADIKEGEEVAKELWIAEKVPTEEEIYERLAGISGDEFLNYAPEDLRLLFMEEGGRVNFHGNRSAYRAIGAGDLLESSIAFAEIDGVIGKRTITEKGKTGYVSVDGNYLAIDTGSTISPRPLPSIPEEDLKWFESIQTYSEEQENSANEQFKKQFWVKEKNYRELVEMIKNGSFTEKAKTSLRFIMKSETGNEQNPFIRTRVVPEPGKLASSAFWPVQITRNLARSYKRNFSDIFTSDELDYLSKFIEQWNKFLACKDNNDPIYGFGGKGEDYFHTPQAKKLYMNMAMKMWEHHIASAGGDVLAAAENWRWRKISQDPNYFLALQKAVQNDSLDS